MQIILNNAEIMYLVLTHNSFKAVKSFVNCIKYAVIK